MVIMEKPDNVQNKFNEGLYEKGSGVTIVLDLRDVSVNRELAYHLKVYAKSLGITIPSKEELRYRGRHYLFAGATYPLEKWHLIDLNEETLKIFSKSLPSFSLNHPSYASFITTKSFEMSITLDDDVYYYVDPFTDEIESGFGDILLSLTLTPKFYND